MFATALVGVRTTNIDWEVLIGVSYPACSLRLLMSTSPKDTRSGLAMKLPKYSAISPSHRACLIPIARPLSTINVYARIFRFFLEDAQQELFAKHDADS